MSHIVLPELNAMQAIANAVEGLSLPERKRVAAWLSDFALQDVQIASQIKDSDNPVDSSSTEVEGANGEDKTQSVEVSISVGQDDGADQEQLATFATFADLYEVAAPKKGAQKAAVAGYWLETVQGQQSWKASEVNKLLKEIDVKVSSMSIVLTNAVKARNPLITELERLGSGERSHKTFCLSDWGHSYVQSCLG